MYSNSNSFLGGGNSQRPGTGQGQQQFGGTGFGGQPSPFAPQQTGFGQQPQLQQQYTGYPMQAQQTGAPQQGLQQQYTGFPGQQQQGGFGGGSQAPPPVPSIPTQYQSQYQQNQPQPTGFQGGQQQPQPTGFQGNLQPAQTGFQSSSPAQSSGPSQPPAAMKPQATGFNEMAASFQTGGTPKPPGRRQQEAKAANTIPNIRLSFITAPDQTKFETLFKSAVGEGSTTMSGEKARDLLMRSRLDGDSLSHIW